jgi:3-oxoacyl-[acyl-carrier protein] reductase
MIHSKNNSKKSGPNDKPIAIVTGGGTGIGAACCLSLANQGFCVGIHFRNSSKPAEDVLSKISGNGGNGFLLQADIGEPDQVDNMIQQIKNSAGRVDVLVNNAGISINDSIISMKIDAFDAQRAILRGTWYLTKKILRLFMLRGSSGRIINISSVVGHTGNAGQIPYTMEKAALDAMTKSLAKELWGRNILVNSVAPGFIATDMTSLLTEDIQQNILKEIPLERMGKPEEVAEVVAFLAVQGSYINGSILHVNGGMYSG